MAHNTDPHPGWKYHVFLSFRGEDTRLNFTDHLYEALKSRTRWSFIETFRDEEELRTGQVISEQLLRAIDESLSAIVILSQNYATSAWCLNELQRIVETKGSLGLVLPVFYHVKPSDVRYQLGSFAQAFEKHEKRYDMEKIQKWRNALSYVASLSGCSTDKFPYEAQFIKKIVEEIWTKIEPNLPTIDDDPVAIGTKVDRVYSCLSLKSNDVLFVGIWGMGGLGKTTLASVVYKKIQIDFEAKCFLHVEEDSKQGDQGLVHLQDKLLSELDVKSRGFATLDQGKDNIRKLLYKKKVLIVLDNVITVRQLENLAGSKDWFGPGSRIIVTTREQHVLTSHRDRVWFQMYELETLNSSESLELFLREAFKGEQPPQDEEFLKLFKEIVEYAKGLPLALKVLGSNLCKKKVDEWKDALNMIRKYQRGDIMNILRISYDMLEDEDKTIFLDIACFFKGWYKDKVIKLLINCDLHPTLGISILIEKALITCTNGVLGMHDLLEEMGKTIVFQESKQNPGERSRLFSLEDTEKVLEDNTGTEKVEGVVLKQQIQSNNKATGWHPGAFSVMRNLRLLIILCRMHLSCGLECLPKSLKVLIWKEYPFKALPLGEKLRELVHLQMNYSKVEQLWSGTQVFNKLKIIDLSYSNDLVQTPNVTDVPLLEELFLDGCVSLVKVHQSVGQHKNLAVLSLIGCVKLETLPCYFEMCSLKRLFLCGCSSLEMLPDFGESMKCLSVLNLMKCSNLVCIPDTITNLKSLRLLNLSGCSTICQLPDNINENKALEDLDLSKTSIRAMDQSLCELKNLKRLSFRGCSGPVSSTCKLPKFDLEFRREELLHLTLPSSISGLSSLNIFDLSNCSLHYGLIPKDLGHLSSLETLILSGNTDLVVPESVVKLPKLRFLEAKGCKGFVDQSAIQYLSDSVVDAGLFLDLWKLWKLYKSDNNELICQVKGHSYPVTYVEIPPKFGNEIFFPMGPSLSKLESSASFIVDIPNECRTGEWWGIVVFIAFDFDPLQCSKFPNLKLSWSFEASRPDEAAPSLYLSSYDAKAHYDCCLVTMIMSDKYIYIQLHHRKYVNISESKPYSKHQKPNFSENSRLRFDVQGEELTMTECRYHVLGENDFRFKARNVDQSIFTMQEFSKEEGENSSEHLSSVNKHPKTLE